MLTCCFYQIWVTNGGIADVFIVLAQTEVTEEGVSLPVTRIVLPLYLAVL